MLLMTLLTMAALAVLPEVVQQIQRDREEEMVHRGTEYMRAIKKYYKKFGRYPSRIEELENTNQMRFLRKRYKDPLAKGGEKDFKLVRMGDPALNMLGMGGIGRGIGPGGGPGSNPGLGQSLIQGGGQSLTQAGGQGFVGAAGGGVRPAGPDDANAPQVTGLPGQQSTGTAAQADGDPNAKVSDSSSENSVGSPGGQAFGGGAILGVASTSKAKTIREFNKKSHYNEWLFVYDPNSDRGGLLKGPIQPDANRNAGINQNGPPTTVVPGQPVPQQPAQQPGGQQPPAADDQ